MTTIANRKPGELVSLCSCLLLLSTLSATASFDSPKVVNPYTNTSPSGKFSCEVDPTDIYGRGDANYRFIHNGSVIWEGSKAFTLVQSAVTDEGVAAGYGYTHGENGFSERGPNAGAGDFVVAMVEPGGRLRLHESVARQESRFLHDIPNPLARGIILDSPGDRFVVRVRDRDINRSKESWWVYEISSGKKLGRFELSAGDGGTASPIRAVPIVGTPLILVHYWRYEHPDASARFALLDSSFKEIWSMTWRRDYNVYGNEAAEERLRDKIWAEGAILDASKSNRFTLFSAKKSEEVSFIVQSNTRDSKKWVVTEFERRKQRPTLNVAGKTLPSRTNALAVLGSFSLQTPEPAQAEVFSDVVGFGFDGAGRIGLLRSGKSENYKLALVETDGALIQEVLLPNPTRPGLARQVKFAWSAKDQWIVTSSELGPEGKTVAWWLNARTGKLEALSGFAAPAVKSLVGTPDGVTGEIELRQNGRRGMDLLRRGFSSKDSLQTLLPSSPA